MNAAMKTSEEALTAVQRQLAELQKLAVETKQELQELQTRVWAEVVFVWAADWVGWVVAAAGYYCCYCCGPVPAEAGAGP